MEVLVDSSVWIDYFRSADSSHQLDALIDENLVVTNEIILSELIPLLVVKRENELIELFNSLKKNPLKINWQEIRSFQVQCLKSGSTGIGIPDIIIAQNAIQNKTSIYSLDKHFGFMKNAGIDFLAF